MVYAHAYMHQCMWVSMSAYECDSIPCDERRRHFREEKTCVSVYRSGVHHTRRNGVGQIISMEINLREIIRRNCKELPAYRETEENFFVLSYHELKLRILVIIWCIEMAYQRPLALFELLGSWDRDSLHN